MAKKDFIEMDGSVIEVFQDGSCKVELQNGMIITGHMSGKIKLHRIKIIRGDFVRCEISPYDLQKGRITFRYNPKEYKKQLEAEAAGEKPTEETSNEE